MKSFGEFKERMAIEEALSPELKEILQMLDQASVMADDKNMVKTLEVIEDARREVIKLAGK